MNWFSMSQSREVFAIPGKADSPTSYGTNKLIKQGAKLVDSVEDIIEELKPHIRNRITSFDDEKQKTKQENINLPVKLSLQEKKIYDALSSVPQHIDDFYCNLNMPQYKIIPILSRLELRHIIKQLPGKLFVRANV